MKKNVETLNKKLLNAAVNATRVKEIKDLIAQGAEVSCTNEWGLTPLMLAAQYNTSVSILNALINAGSDIHAQEPKYRSNALLLACNKTSNPKIIEALLNAGASLTERNYLGESAIIMAVNTNPEARVVTALIKAGADINDKDYQGHSVVEYAKLNKRTYLINTLKKLGAN